MNKDHPKGPIIGGLKFQLYKQGEMTKISNEHAMVSYINKQRRTNHKDYHNCLFACLDSGEILKKFDFATVKTASTPIETNKVLVKDEEAEAIDVSVLFINRSMIGSLMYLHLLKQEA
ncbi:hypothetical protein Tco_0747634 [Tanacetum coccineum]|uniref:Uncharacterized protein n=1 Tax=Tanacetum coccineum TaxID=301880 RepID=A0ABQ4YWC3_9ASTR